MKTYSFLAEIRTYDGELTRRVISTKSKYLVGAIRKAYQEHEIERIIALLEV